MYLVRRYKNDKDSEGKSVKIRICREIIGNKESGMVLFSFRSVASVRIATRVSMEAFQALDECDSSHDLNSHETRAHPSDD